MEYHAVIKKRESEEVLCEPTWSGQESTERGFREEKGQLVRWISSSFKLNLSPVWGRYFIHSTNAYSLLEHSSKHWNIAADKTEREGT